MEAPFFSIKDSLMTEIIPKKALPTTSTIAPIVIINNNGKLVVSSRNVANVFNKAHYIVMRDIRNILSNNNDQEFNEYNFVFVNYTDAKGESRPECLLTKDGFTLLVMHYSGPKAITFQIAYIKRFNEMEAALKANKQINLDVSKIELPKPSEFLTSLELKPNPYQNEKLIEFLDADILMPERLPSEIGVRTEQFTDVFERNGKAVTSSLVVADAFQKKHSSVMRSIESLITKIRGTYPNEDYESLFYSGTYIANNNREYKSYCITRKGFVFLVFSFTGTRAIQYKYPLYRRLEEYDTLLLIRRITEDHQSYKTKRMLCLHDLSKQKS